jgi:hypothetical protein
LSTIGLGNVGWIISFCQAPTITMVLSLVGGKEKLIGKLCPTMWRLDGIAHYSLIPMFPHSITLDHGL